MKKIKQRTRTEKKTLKSDTFTVDKEGQLLDSIIDAFPHKSRKLLKAVLRDSQVQVNNKTVTQLITRLK